MSKLDRFFVSNNLLNIFPHISGITLDRFLSDHRPILLRESAHDYGPVPFRFFHHWIHLEGFNDFVTSTWNSAPSVDSNGMRNLAGKLKFLKAHIKIWIKDNKSETVSTIANLKKELNQLDAVIDKGTGTEVEAEKRMEVLAALRNIDHIHSMDLAQKAKIKWSIEGDENSNFFHGILNKKRNQMNIRGITIDGVWKEQPNDVKQEFLSHFQDRFAKPSERRANIDMRFPKTISEDQSQDLEREVSNSLNRDLNKTGCLEAVHRPNPLGSRLCRSRPKKKLGRIGSSVTIVALRLGQLELESGEYGNIFSVGLISLVNVSMRYSLPNIGEETRWVDMVIVPATTGQIGILPGHVPTIAKLQPDLLSVHERNVVKKYFISIGFAFIHANSYADILAVEAVPLDRLDPAQVQKGLSEFTQKLGSTSTDAEKAEAQIGVNVHSALNFALTG
ncbi:RNA-directed DNA polymerase, eukaryota [Tanacetum coccineum]